MRYYYSILDGDGVCVGFIDTHKEINRENYIESNSLDHNAVGRKLVGKRWDGSEWVDNPNEPAVAE